MAGDWIKMRTDLYRDPKVCAIADALLDDCGDLARFVNQNNQRDMSVTRNVMRNAAVGALVSVWGIARHRGKRSDDDLVLVGVDFGIIDDMADIQGFGDAMATVGWAKETTNGLVFPNFFEEFNVEPRELASANAERQRRFRERQKSNENRNVTVTLRNALEKRREEKSIGDESPITPLAPSRIAASEQNATAQPAKDDPVVMTYPVVGNRGHEWPLLRSKLDEFVECYPGLDVMTESRKALQWCRDNPAKRKTPRGMSTFLARWFEKAQNRRGGQGESYQSPGKAAAQSESIGERLARIRKEQGCAD